MSLDQILADLKLKYIADLTDVIALLESLHQSSDFTQIREEFHKLNGTAGTYGLSEVSQLASAMENLCVSKPEEVDKATPTAIQILREIHHVRSQKNEALDLDRHAEFAMIQSLYSLS